MSKTKHWIVVEHPEAKADHQFIIREQDSTVNIGSAWNINLTDARANAALIAASPDLLFALEQAYDYISDCFPASSPDYTASPLSDDEYNLLKTIKEALAKAKGETDAL